MKHELPLLSSLEIYKESGNPAADFYKDLDIAAEQRRCFVYDWLAKPVPTLEELEEAWNNRERLEQTYKVARKAATA